MESFEVYLPLGLNTNLDLIAFESHVQSCNCMIFSRDPIIPITVSAPETFSDSGLIVTNVTRSHLIKAYMLTVQLNAHKLVHCWWKARIRLCNLLMTPTNKKFNY